MDYQTEFDEQQYRGKLNRRFISGILVGCFVALFISAAVVMGYLLTINSATVQTNSGDSVLSDETLTKINKIESEDESEREKHKESVSVLHDIPLSGADDE